MDDWASKRIAELEAAAPVKRKKTDAYVQVPLWWAEAAAKATRTPKALVCIRLLHASWKARSATFTLPSAWFQRRGISRGIWRRTLHELEAAGLITVERRSGKTPVITLVVL
jgi:hypothetical protein